ncbi:hypothetical protein Desgi_3335 [Desulfoscipio gibsoniae DSM 7213]|uniref:Uncharacterized protein n=1 Tax=Desulfoscipio gibsoniae DSM 7213 TaxID=767817 RepID=R4KQ31_9FIRM|nr:hypothetical protein Desgi_3335 [Desulfoscipio gibsoniae DSM 7213]
MRFFNSWHDMKVDNSIEEKLCLLHTKKKINAHKKTRSGQNRRAWFSIAFFLFFYGSTFSERCKYWWKKYSPTATSTANKAKAVKVV